MDDVVEVWKIRSDPRKDANGNIKNIDYIVQKNK